TATYWEVGRRIVEFEQGGEARAAYGQALLPQLAQDLTTRCGRGFSRQNLQLMRAFYLSWRICQTVSGELRAAASLAASSTANPNELNSHAIQADVRAAASAFPLPWSHYVRLLSVDNLNARAFYEAEALRGGWSIRQL